MAILAVLAGGGGEAGAKSNAGVTSVNFFEYILFLRYQLLSFSFYYSV